MHSLYFLKFMQSVLINSKWHCLLFILSLALAAVCVNESVKLITTKNDAIFYSFFPVYGLIFAGIFLFLSQVIQLNACMKYFERKNVDISTLIEQNPPKKNIKNKPSETNSNINSDFGDEEDTSEVSGPSGYNRAFYSRLAKLSSILFAMIEISGILIFALIFTVMNNILIDFLIIFIFLTPVFITIIFVLKAYKKNELEFQSLTISGHVKRILLRKKFIASGLIFVFLGLALISVALNFIQTDQIPPITLVIFLCVNAGRKSLAALFLWNRLSPFVLNPELYPDFFKVLK